MKTYALVGELGADEKAAQLAREDRSNFTLQFNLEQMTDHEREDAEEKLMHALDAFRAAKD